MPSKLFDMLLDAIFVSHNRLEFEIPDNLGNSQVAALVDDKFKGCLLAREHVQTE